MAEVSELLDGLRGHLVAQGVVKVPGAAGADPPMYLAPEGGAPAPGDKQGNEDHPDAIASAFASGGFAARPYEEFLRRDTVDVWLRVRKMPFAAELEEQIRAALLGEYGRRDWTMGGVHVHSTQEWRPLSPVPAAGSGHSFVVAYLFEYSA